MSLVKYIARLQRLYVLLAGKIVDPQYEIVCQVNISRETASTIFWIKKGIRFVVKQNCNGTYLIDYQSLIWTDPFHLISRSSNWYLPDTDKNIGRYSITKHLVRLKVFPPSGQLISWFS